MNKITALFFMITILVFSGFKKKTGEGRIEPADRWNAANGSISIANVTDVEGNSGQHIVEIMIAISEPAPETVTVGYKTKDGTASAGSDYAAAEGSVTFAKGETMKKIRVSVIGDKTCEPSETFQIVLSNPAPGTLMKGIGTVTIVNDDFQCGGNSGSANISAVPAVYDVRLTYTGYTTFYGTAADCAIRPNGKVTLTGLLSGTEDISSDDDIMYTGVLQLDIDMDICSAKRLPNGEDRLCGITVIGCGPVKTELEVQFDQRGGYVKIEDESHEFIRMAFGSCDKPQIMEEQDMIPNKTIASIFNGTPLPMLTNRTLQVGRYVETGSAGEMVVEVLRKIR